MTSKEEKAELKAAKKAEKAKLKAAKKAEKGTGRFKLGLMTFLIGFIIGALIFTVGVKYLDVLAAKKAASIEVPAPRIVFEDLGELATQSSTIANIKHSTESRELFGIKVPGTKSEILFSYVGEVKAGIDFSKVSYELDADNKVIYLTLPHAKILSSKVDPNSIKTFIDKDSWFSRIDLEEQAQIIAGLENDNIERAKEGDILNKADSYAKILLEKFVKGKDYYKDFSVEYVYVEE